MSMSRQLRRAAERQASKNARKEGYPNAAAATGSSAATTVAPQMESEATPENLYTVDGMAAYEARKKAEYFARLEANRANAQHSTGPRSPAGKATASQNSFKHGIYSNKLVLPSDDPTALERLKGDLLKEHQPVGVTETLLVGEMATHFWRMRRFRRIEDALMQEENLCIPHLTAAQRFMNSAERSFYKALKTLHELQKQRGFVPHSAICQNAAVGFVPPNSAECHPVPSRRAAPNSESRAAESASSAA